MVDALSAAASDVGRELDVRAGLRLMTTDGDLRHFLSIARQLAVRAGHVLFERGQPVARVYLVTAGRIELRAPDAPSWQIASPGAVGMLDFMRGRSHARTAIALTDARLVELDATDYREYMEDSFEVGQRLLSELSHDFIEAALLLANPERLLGSPVDKLPAPGGDRELTVIDRLITLSRVPAFAGGSVQALVNLAEGSREVRHRAGDVVAAAGESSSRVLVLARGELDLELPGSAQPIRRRAIDLAGHLGELATTPRHYGLVAHDDVTLLVIDREELLDRSEEHFELAQSMFKAVAEAQDALNDQHGGRTDAR